MSDDLHAQSLEDAIRWCIDHRAEVQFHPNGMVKIIYNGSLRIVGDSFLDAIMDVMDT